jgi:hypothetical protein
VNLAYATMAKFADKALPGIFAELGVHVNRCGD